MALAGLRPVCEMQFCGFSYISIPQIEGHASRYRSPEEMAAWQLKDPIDRLEKYMRSKGMLDDSLKEKIAAELTAKVQDAVQRLEECPVEPKVIFTHTYASLDPDLKEQLDTFQRQYGLRGGD